MAEDLDPVAIKLRDLRIKYARVFEEVEGGDEVLQDIFKFCGMGDIEYVRGDTHHSAFNGGKRSVAIYISDMLSLALDDKRQAEAQE